MRWTQKMRNTPKQDIKWVRKLSDLKLVLSMLPRGQVCLFMTLCDCVCSVSSLITLTPEDSPKTLYVILWPRSWTLACRCDREEVTAIPTCFSLPSMAKAAIHEICRFFFLYLRPVEASSCSLSLVLILPS